MNELHIAFTVIFLLGMLCSRIALVGARGGIAHTSIVMSLVGMVATFMTLSLVVWSLASLDWYWPVGLFLLGSIISAVAITRANWGAWFLISPFMDLIVVAGGLYLWIWQWPF